MRIALVAPPFIPVPPVRYGGTELFVAHLADGLVREGHDVVVYANGESTSAGELRWLYERGEWPLQNPSQAVIKETAHFAWACADAASDADVIHVNSGPGVVFSRFVDVPFVATLHHPADRVLSALYAQYPEVHYVAISRFQQAAESMPRLTTVHHGLELDRYRFVDAKDQYLAFLGRIAPAKGTHLAIEVARRAGLPLKIAGEIQPCYADYWETMVKPHVDGRQIEYIGEADLAVKNELLGRASAFLFPIQWDEPFGLVMLEAMACGTPVLAFRAGSVPEIVRNGINGWICRDVEDMARRARKPGVAASSCRAHVVANFSVSNMTRRYIDLYLGAIEGAGRRESSVLVADLPLAAAPQRPPASVTSQPLAGRSPKAPAPVVPGRPQ